MQLSSAPNAAIPPGLRKKAYDEEAVKGANGHAAGIAFVAPDGCVLLLRRSDKEENFAGHWALPGGGVEDGESPEQGAAREAREEIGVDVEPESLSGVHKNVTPTGKAYHTFARPVTDKFEPVLNDEHTDHQWASLDSLPQPMHPAVEALLSPAPMGTDSRQRMALDKGSARTFDEEGRLHVAETNICKACVNPYKGEEIPGWEEIGLEKDKVYRMFRPPEELEKATSTSNGIQLMRVHKPVDADDHKPYDVAGAVGTSARWEAPFIKNAITIWHAKDIDGIETEEKYQLSPGYHYDPVMQSGTFGGEAYDGIMINIRFNHVAIVEEGRQGNEVVVEDGLADLQWAAIEQAILGMRRKRASR